MNHDNKSRWKSALVSSIALVALVAQCVYFTRRAWLDNERRGVKMPGVELTQDLWRDISHRVSALTIELQEEFNEYRQSIRK